MIDEIKTYFKEIQYINFYLVYKNLIKYFFLSFFIFFIGLFYFINLFFEVFQRHFIFLTIFIEFHLFNPYHFLQQGIEAYPGSRIIRFASVLFTGDD